jgi:hypothetical protein
MQLLDAALLLDVPVFRLTLHLLAIVCVVVDLDSLHDHAPAGLIAAAAVTALTTRKNGLWLDDRRHGRSDATRHVEDEVKLD